MQGILVSILKATIPSSDDESQHQLAPGLFLCGGKNQSG